MAKSTITTPSMQHAPEENKAEFSLRFSKAQDGLDLEPILAGMNAHSMNELPWNLPLYNDNNSDRDPIKSYDLPWHVFTKPMYSSPRASTVGAESYYQPRIVSPLAMSPESIRADATVIKLLNDSEFMHSSTVSSSDLSTLGRSMNLTNEDGSASGYRSMLVRVRLETVLLAADSNVRGYTALFYDLERGCYYKLRDVYLPTLAKGVAYAARIERLEIDADIETRNPVQLHRQIHQFFFPDRMKEWYSPAKQTVEQLLDSIVPKTHTIEAALAGPARRNARGRALYVLPSSLVATDPRGLGTYPRELGMYIWQDYVMKRHCEAGVAVSGRRFADKVAARLSAGASMTSDALAREFSDASHTPALDRLVYAGLFYSSTRYVLCRYIHPNIVNLLSESDAAETLKKLQTDPLKLVIPLGLDDQLLTRLRSDDALQALADRTSANGALLQAPNRMLTNAECAMRFRAGSALGSEYDFISYSRWTENIRGPDQRKRFADPSVGAVAFDTNDSVAKKLRQSADNTTDHVSRMIRDNALKSILSAENGAQLLDEMQRIYETASRRYRIEGVVWQRVRKTPAVLELIKNEFLVGREVPPPLPTASQLAGSHVAGGVLWLSDIQQPAFMIDVSPVTVCRQIDSSLEQLIYSRLQAGYYPTEADGASHNTTLYRDRLREALRQNRERFATDSALISVHIAIQRILAENNEHEWRRSYNRNIAPFECAFMLECIQSPVLARRLLSHSRLMFQDGITVIDQCSPAEIEALERFSLSTLQDSYARVGIVRGAGRLGPEAMLAELNAKLSYVSKTPCRNGQPFRGACRWLVLLESASTTDTAMRPINIFVAGTRFLSGDTVVLEATSEVVSDNGGVIGTESVLNGTAPLVRDPSSSQQLHAVVVRTIKL